jgi:GT2 family glycosyltransferase
MAVRVYVVDNASGDGSAEMVRAEFPQVRLIVNPLNRGFGQANNQAIAAGDEPLILLLNSDAELTPGALPALVGVLERHPAAAVVGARLVFPDGRFQASYNRFPRLGHDALALAGLARWAVGEHYPSASEARSREARTVDWVGGACMLVRRAALAGEPGFDPDYAMYSEEMDLCRRIHDAGWAVRYAPDAVAVHHRGQSARQRPIDQPRLLWESRLLYYRKHRRRHEAALLAMMIRVAYLGRALVWGARSLAARPAERAEWRSRTRSALSLVIGL